MSLIGFKTKVKQDWHVDWSLVHQCSENTNQAGHNQFGSPHLPIKIHTPIRVKISETPNRNT